MVAVSEKVRTCSLRLVPVLVMTFLTMRDWLDAWVWVNMARLLPCLIPPRPISPKLLCNGWLWTICSPVQLIPLGLMKMQLSLYIQSLGSYLRIRPQEPPPALAITFNWTVAWASRGSRERCWL